MFEENIEILMANGEMKSIREVTNHSYVMCEDGSITKVESVDKDLQTSYRITQITKHNDDHHKKKPIFHRLEFNCSLGHLLPLAVPTEPKLERSLKHQKYLVKTKKLIELQTDDGRIIIIPKDHYVNFPMTVEGEYQARSYMETVVEEQPKYIDFSIQLRDLDYLNSHIRLISLMKYSPVWNGNGTLSQHITGQKHLVTPAVLSMAWLLGLWMGDGTTRHPEISMDSHDEALWEGLKEHVSHWGLIPTYKDATVPLRAKHVKLYHGSRLPGRKHQMFRTNNPFWKCLINLEFKNKNDGSKQIPKVMWHEDIEVRESFLAGLIDADGYVGYGEVEGDVFGVSIQTIYSSIMDGIVNIARSLGIKASVTTKPVRQNVIEGRTVQCKFTYECSLVGKTPLQNILSKCKSGHKRRPEPQSIIREPVYFRFTEEKRGLNWVYGIRTNSDKPILLGNKVVTSTCNNQYCRKEQRKISRQKNLRRCKACSKISSRCYFKDWTGRHNLCGRCRTRYVSTGYRCLGCHYVPDQRSINKFKQRGVSPECDKCKGPYYFDAVRGPLRGTHTLIANQLEEPLPAHQIIT